MKRITLLLFLLSNILLAQVPEGKQVISSLYIYDLQSGESTLILKEERHFEAPNWSPDGTFLLINSAGKLEKIALDGKI
ncbi:hypothetical protein V8V91_12845 [Algoriphagus halophilus]|uniref:hypothetical protein n=1 Tax=Algoriphagus halophilus TaxID=226505 RepID=UPI00358FFAEE